MPRPSFVPQAVWDFGYQAWASIFRALVRLTSETVKGGGKLDHGGGGKLDHPAAGRSS